MTVMPISPTNDAFVRLGRAADMIARENEAMTREDVMDAFKCGIFQGDWEFPPQSSEDEARAPRRLQMEITVPTSTLPPVLQLLDIRPRSFYAVNRSTIASVMYCARALPGDHADWNRQIAVCARDTCGIVTAAAPTPAASKNRRRANGLPAVIRCAICIYSAQSAGAKNRPA